MHHDAAKLLWRLIHGPPDDSKSSRIDSAQADAEPEQNLFYPRAEFEGELAHVQPEIRRDYSSYYGREQSYENTKA